MGQRSAGLAWNDPSDRNVWVLCKLQNTWNMFRHGSFQNAQDVPKDVSKEQRYDHTCLACLFCLGVGMFVPSSGCVAKIAMLGVSSPHWTDEFRALSLSLPELKLE